MEDKIKAYQSRGIKVKAVIGMDYAGHPCDWRTLREIADKYDLQLVNDNCHALGASYFGDKQYSLQFADVMIQSYHPVKHITTGEGGAVLTNDPQIGEKVRRLRTHGMTKDPAQLENSDGPWYYEMYEVGFNYRITDFQCALGSSQLKKLDQFVEKRREIAKKYDQSFYNNDILTIPKTKNSVVHSYHLYPLQIDFERINENKVQLFEEMKLANVNLQVHYIPVHLQPYYRNNFGFKVGDYPVAENFYSNEVSLPIHFDLSFSDQEKLIEKVDHFCSV